MAKIINSSWPNINMISPPQKLHPPPLPPNSKMYFVCIIPKYFLVWLDRDLPGPVDWPKSYLQFLVKHSQASLAARFLRQKIEKYYLII